VKGAGKMTESELQELCSEWQKRLKLQNWNIICKFVRHNEIGADTIAEAHYRLNLETAVLKVLDQDDYLRVWDRDFPQDIEESVVHELLHLELATLAPEGGYYGTQEIIQEQTIDRLARVLVALKRETEQANTQPRRDGLELHPLAEAAD
jgi:hypothetical protein